MGAKRYLPGYGWVIIGEDDPPDAPLEVVDIKPKDPPKKD